MEKTDARKKISILGGGMGGLATAYYLTNDPDQRRNHEVTLYQLGWRLGGKCASSRWENARIEEHGIHGFMGSYFNALPLMADVYAELARGADQPLSTFDEAFLPTNLTMLWEWQDNHLKPWPVRTPSNAIPPTNGASYKGVGTAIEAILNEIAGMLGHHDGVPQLIGAGVKLFIDNALQSLSLPLEQGPRHPLVAEVQGARKLIASVMDAFDTIAPQLADKADTVRRALLTLDFYATLIIGTLVDDVAVRGFDVLDEENWSDWLTRHGLHAATLASPLPLVTVNICYQSPDGDTSRAARMGAGCYLDWSLRGCAYMGALIWSFAAGTGEVVVAPMYEVLKRRGVKFEYFHKVEALRIDPEDGRKIGSVEMTVQATLKDPDAGYQPLIQVKGLPSWPKAPLYDQLVEGEALKAADIDLESYWSGWPDAAHAHLKAPKVLRHGVDYDELVFAIAVGAVPYLCRELVEANAAWKGMVDNLPALTTQAMQLWLSRDLYEMGWTEPLDPAQNELALSGTYFCPPNGNANFPDLLKWEDWPADNMPKALWYFCGLMPDYEPPPPFTDTDYPRRQRARVKAQSIQYLQTAIGTMLPQATVRANNGLGDPMGLDFGLLVDTRDGGAEGVMRFDSQFWRANIDPTERYVSSPPGSVDYRLEAWGSGFHNLTLAGDWIYTGINIGSFEGATMGGKLASYAISASPPLETVIGYPTMPRPAGASGLDHAPPPHADAVSRARLTG